MKKLFTIAFLSISMIVNANNGTELCDYELFRTKDTQVVCDMMCSLNQRYNRVSLNTWKSKDGKHIISMWNLDGSIVFEKHCIN